MSEPMEGGGKEFAAFLRTCRSTDDVTSGKVRTIKGTISKSSDTAFAIRTCDGQAFEIEAAAVSRFKVLGGGLDPEVEIALSSDALKAAKQIVLKPVYADGGY